MTLNQDLRSVRKLTIINVLFLMKMVSAHYRSWLLMKMHINGNINLNIAFYFRLTIFEGALTIDDEHIDRLKTCNKNPVNEISIFEACRDELKHFFGEDFNKLDEYGKQYLASLKTKDVA